MLIDATYFTKGLRQVKNATLGNSLDANGLEVIARIEQLIAELQGDYLAQILGDTLAADAEAYMDSDGGEEHPLAPLVRRLREPFADYVLYYILREGAVEVTMNGTVFYNQQSDRVKPAARQCDAWNRMVDAHLRLLTWNAARRVPYAMEPDGNVLTYINALNI